MTAHAQKGRQDVRVDSSAAFSDDERLEIGEQVGRIVMYFADVAKEARRERDAAIRDRDVAVEQLHAAQRKLDLFTADRPDGPVRLTAVNRG